ncbi:MAG: hypothetical protein O7H41_19890 [Planctomycetota bacterium]|nr:hypothetical protein [Planctomycetota bacterium]
MATWAVSSSRLLSLIVFASACASASPRGPGVSLDEAESLAIGLEYDDTIFTQSARTRNFTGQGVIPRFTYTRATNTYEGNVHKSDPDDQDLKVYRTTVRVVYGATEDATVGLTVPYLVKSLKTGIGGSRVTLNSDGVGDATLSGKWRLFKKPELGGTTELAAIFGLELPTGRDDVRDDGMRLPAPLQPGSGGVDAILGLAGTRLWDGGRWLVNTDLIYKANSEANDYRFGNVIRFDAGMQFRAYPIRYERYDQFTLNLILELNGRYAERDKVNGDPVDASGGLIIRLSPGVQTIVTENLLFEAGIQIPVFRHLHGLQLSEDVSGTVGARLLF